MDAPASALIRAAQAEPARPWPRHVLTPEGWRSLVAALAGEPGLSLQGLWADTGRVHALFLPPDGTPLLASVPVEAGLYAALSPARPGAAAFERALADLWGHEAAGGTDARPWYDGDAWPVLHPLSARPVPNGGQPEPPEFLPAEDADGAILHQLPLGPVRAGLEGPIHFRLTCAGERVARLEARLGYAHKGTPALMRGKPVRAAARLAARLAGGSSVAHGIAFARAVEAALDTPAPPRADALRAVMAELERVGSHLGDLALLCRSAGAPLPASRFGLHREEVLRACGAAFGQRLMLDLVVPGGVGAELLPAEADTLLRALDGLDGEWPALAGACGDGTSLAERFAGLGRIRAETVARFVPPGVVGRASGLPADARRAPGYPPYDAMEFDVSVLGHEGASATGDVAARVKVRLAEVAESMSMVRALLPALPSGPVLLALPSGSGEGMGVAEGPRGACWHWVRLDAGMVAAAWARDPGWLHWPMLEDAIGGAEVDDFLLVAHSIGASPSGTDL